MNARTIRAALRLDYLSETSHVGNQWALIFIGAVFWWMAAWRPEAFSASLYGHLAVSFQAEAWAAAMALPAIMVLIGLRDPVKRWMVSFGAGAQLLQFWALGYSAIFTGGEPIIGVFCWLFFGRQYACMMWSALHEP